MFPPREIAEGGINPIQIRYLIFSLSYWGQGEVGCMYFVYWLIWAVLWLIATNFVLGFKGRKSLLAIILKVLS